MAFTAPATAPARTLAPIFFIPLAAFFAPLFAVFFIPLAAFFVPLAAAFFAPLAAFFTPRRLAPDPRDFFVLPDARRFDVIPRLERFLPRALLRLVFFLVAITDLLVLSLFEAVE